ncbi:hypothetical protein H0H93_012957 [Arthromyces matolae]|nr:hypothetical protein H0H93_012957 [Arthromyces matolae]
MSGNNGREMPAQKRRRVMAVADGFETQKPQPAGPKAPVQVPQFSSAFNEKRPQSAQTRTVSKPKFDPRTDFVTSKPVSRSSVNSKSNLKQLPVPRLQVISSNDSNEKQSASTSRLQPPPDPRTLTTVGSSSGITSQLRRLQPPAPLPAKPISIKHGGSLKALPAPTAFSLSETPMDTTSVRSISTTEIALATDLSTDNGAAELAHIFLRDQHPDIAVSNQHLHSDWTLGGFAARSSELSFQFHTSLVLWQKEMELQLASLSPSHLNPDLRLRIVKIIDVPPGLKSSSPRKPRPTSAAVSTGAALCRILAAVSSKPHLKDSMREKQQHVVVLSFPTIAPPRLRGRDGIYVRNPEDFIVGHQVCVWEPWHEVSLLPQAHGSVSHSNAAAVSEEVTTLVAAPFPSLPSTYPQSSPQVADENIQTSDLALLCSRFVPQVNTMTEIHIQETSQTTPRVKKAPTKADIPVPFSYIASDDGTDENLLILLHGLGGYNLGRQLKLPQTAVLALRAPEQVPFLYEDAFQWYTSFDGLGDLIERPNPTSALDLMEKVVQSLIERCGWQSRRIHLFGFAQGGTVALELGIRWWKKHATSLNTAEPPSNTTDGSLGSIVSVSGPLLSYPTLSVKNSTPVLIVHNPSPAETALPAGAINDLKKAYVNIIEKTSKMAGMPSSKAGWQPIMEFWSTHLGRRQMGGLYEVMSGMTPVT